MPVYAVNAGPDFTMLFIGTFLFLLPVLAVVWRGEAPPPCLANHYYQCLMHVAEAEWFNVAHAIMPVLMCSRLPPAYHVHDHMEQCQTSAAAFANVTAALVPNGLCKLAYLVFVGIPFCIWAGAMDDPSILDPFVDMSMTINQAIMVTLGATPKLSVAPPSAI